MYAGLNNTTVTVPSITWYSTTTSYNASGKILQGLNLVGSQLLSHNPVMLSYRGSMVFWVRCDVISAGYMNQVISIYPGPPFIHVDLTFGASGNATFYSTYDGSYGGEGAVRENLPSDTFNFAVGDWHHFVWTWQGTHQKLYRDSVLVAEKYMVSHFPYTMAGDFRLGGNGGPDSATLDEVAIYNYPFTQTDVNNAYASSSSVAINTSTAYGLDVAVQWAPGIGNVWVTADAGTEFATRADHFDVTVFKDSTSVATATISNLNGGYGQSLIPVTTPFAAGTYTAVVVAKDVNGNTLDTVTSTSWTVPSTSWLGNSLGIAPAGTVQAPWLPISVSGKTMTVWGRRYDLTGGWGLPQQITSQGQNLLAVPVDIDFDTGSGAFNLTPGSLTITSVANDVVTWTGTASGGGISASISGSLEYDGMMLIALTLSPTAGPVSISTIKLQTKMPAARALFFSTQYDQSGQALSYDPAVPTSVGTVFDNAPGAAIPGTSRAFQPTKTRLITSLVLSDDDRGLEWFADNLSGWSVDQTIASGAAFQKLIVDASTNVRIENSFATNAFTLSSARTITFGYQATPIKDLPSDWRTMQVGDSGGASPTIAGTFLISWSYEGDTYRGSYTGWSVSTTYAINDIVESPTNSVLYKSLSGGNVGHDPVTDGGVHWATGTYNTFWRSFALSPGSAFGVTLDTAAVFNRTAIVRSNASYLAPYTDSHVVIAPGTPPDDTTTVLTFLRQEFGDPDNTQQVGFTSMLTTGARDYWAYEVNYSLSQQVMQSIYIDEHYPQFECSATVISGNGFVDDTGITRFGYNTLEARKLLKRLRQLFITYGLRPFVWLDASGGGIPPHLWGWADIVSDGEGVAFPAIFVSTNGSTGAGNNVLSFADTTGIVVNMCAENVTVPGTIPVKTIVTGVTATTITLSANVTGAGVANGDNIRFIYPDFVYRYGTTAGLDWLRGITRSVKYGWIQVFLDEMRGYISNAQNWNYYWRGAISLLQLHDCLIIGTYVQQYVDWMQPRATYGLGTGSYSFIGYWANTAITTGNSSVLCSYWNRARECFVHIANLNTTSFSGTISFNRAALGLSGQVTVRNAETGAVIPTAGDNFSVTIGQHDYAVFDFSMTDGGGAARPGRSGHAITLKSRTL